MRKAHAVELLLDLRRVRDEHGRVSHSVYGEHGGFAYSTVASRFGTHGDAKRCAGLLHDDTWDRPELWNDPGRLRFLVETLLQDAGFVADQLGCDESVVRTAMELHGVGEP